MAPPTDTRAGHAGEPHVLPLSVYWGVFLALVVGTIVTVWTATFDLGAMNLVVALAIATVKASLVILFFMHVKYSSKLVWVFAGMGFFWVVMMFAFTLMDFQTRSW
jgi:cytochrome c oxidase subunit 4